MVLLDKLLVTEMFKVVILNIISTKYMKYFIGSQIAITVKDSKGVYKTVKYILALYM